MNELITNVALDAMGGDNAPFEVIKGAMDAISQSTNLKVTLVGKEDVIREELSKTGDEMNLINARVTEISMQVADLNVLPIRSSTSASTPQRPFR